MRIRKRTRAKSPILEPKKKEPALSPAEASALWRQYKASPNDADRSRLIFNYQPLVKYLAERTKVKLPECVEVDDLMSSGQFGLMDAIDKFDPDRGVKFETYASPRIWGSIVDELREMDWLPRLVRNRNDQHARAVQELKTILGRHPNDEEIRKKLNLTRSEFEQVRSDSQAASVVSLSRKWFETDSNKDICEVDVISDHRSVNPVDAVHSDDIQRLVTTGLSHQEKLIICLYYVQEMTMKEIGQALDLSESRVSQVHGSLLLRLRATCRERLRDLMGRQTRRARHEQAVIRLANYKRRKMRQQRMRKRQEKTEMAVA